MARKVIIWLPFAGDMLSLELESVVTSALAAGTDGDDGENSAGKKKKKKKKKKGRELTTF